jgi:GNAT superfamily N-acetyltransferase
MAEHPLDRPVWHALLSRQAAFAVGDGSAKRFLPDVGIFAAARDDSEEALRALGGLVPPDGSVILLQPGESPVPPGTRVDKIAMGVQMVAEGVAPSEPMAPVERLTEADAPAMLELATLTQPGPFFANTHRLGAFWGIRTGGRLVAMAGERMKLDGYTEVSGVCTHPDFRGRGYAATLSRVVAGEILERGETPLLHAYATNTPAIDLYRALGFVLRSPMVVTVLARCTGGQQS